jgi:DNA invertase Pin-like site-specific DNA recombinase
MAKIGYARVSTRSKNDDRQVDDLTAYGRDKIFTDTRPGGVQAPAGALNDQLALEKEG